MRKILFRGKRVDNGEWVEGYYAAEPYTKNTYNYGYILENEKDLFAKKAWLVDSRTVGQYTGLTDKNGTRVFEGDILKEYGSAPEYSLMVIKNTGFGCFIEFYFHGEIHSTEQVGHTGWLSYDEVIGNIHDNPKLLNNFKNQ